MNDAVVQANGLAFAYSGEKVLHGISFTINSGEIFGLVGADGAGKSTLLALAAGQLLPQSGEINILGKPASKAELRGEIAYMPQHFGLYPDLSVLENLTFFADLHGLPKSLAKERIAGLLDRTGLKGFESRRSGHLSGGMMQKLALASALVHEPKAMFLDEPTTGVDPVSRRAFWRLLETVKEEGVAILFATANMDEAERCDRVAMLEQGEITKEGAPLDLIRRIGGTLVTVYGPSVRDFRRKIQDLPAVQMVFPVGVKLNVWLAGQQPFDAFQQALKKLSPDLTTERTTPTLHEAALRDLAQHSVYKNSAGRPHE